MVTFQGGFCVTPMCDILFCFYYSVIFCAGGSIFALFRTFSQLVLSNQCVLSMLRNYYVIIGYYVIIIM